MNEELERQFAEQSKHCPFCRIIRGEIKGEQVYDDRFLKGILDINPVAKGHTLLVPKKHYPILPFMPNDEFVHMFRLMPRFARAVMDAMLASGLNIMISNGAAAGQQSPHFLLHMIPREKNDWLTNFSFDNGIIGKTEDYALYHHNLPAMMENERTDGEQSEFLKKIKQGKNIVYEDGKCIGVVPEKPLCAGHIIFYGNADDLRKLSGEESLHLFRLASHCATAAYEGYKAAGSNIIIKTGLSDDSDVLEVHIIPRHENDGINFQHEPKKFPDFKEISSKIKDRMFYIEHEQKHRKKEKLTINLDEIKKNEISEKPKTPADEIMQAIEKQKMG